MDEVRFYMSVFVIVILPAVIAFWIVIHAGIGTWRHHATWMAFSAALVAMLGVAIPVWLYREVLVGTDFGGRTVLAIIGVIIYISTWFMSGPIRRELTLRTFAGLPEVNNETSELLRNGPFALVRHPRYLMVLIGIVGWAMICNFSGVYVVSALSALGFLLVIHLEERELVERFGDDYRAYQREVPALIPNAQSFGAYLAQ